MEFHKKKGKILGTGIGITGMGVLGTLLLIGWFSEGGRLPIFMFLAPILLFVGIGVGAYGMIPFRLRIDAQGITTRHPPEGLHTFVPWSHIADVTIERKPGDDTDKAPYVVLWPLPGAEPGTEPSFRRDGRPAYLLGQLDEIQEPEEQIRDALTRCAGPRAHGASASEHTPHQPYPPQGPPPPHQPYPPHQPPYPGYPRG